MDDIFTSVDLFGKDHWSLLMLIEHLVVDHGGKAREDDQRFRVAQFDGDNWKYGTRLNNGVVLEDHDDFNCIQDLQVAGLVHAEADDSGEYILFELTEDGWRVAHELRKHKGNGFKLNEFRYTWKIVV